MRIIIERIESCESAKDCPVAKALQEAFEYPNIQFTLRTILVFDLSNYHVVAKVGVPARMQAYGELVHAHKGVVPVALDLPDEHAAIIREAIDVQNQMRRPRIPSQSERSLVHV